MEPLTKIGKLSTTHGVKGHLVLFHELSQPKEMLPWPALMLEVNTNSFIPYFIEEIKLNGDEGAMIKFEGVNTIEDAKFFTGCNVYASPLVKVKSLKVNEWLALIGYSVLHEQKLVGLINDFINNNGQELFSVATENGDLYIPVHDTFIKQVLPQKKQIVVQLPEGYLDTFN